MNGSLLLVVLLIAFTGLCDTANHLGLKVCADRVGLPLVDARSVVRFTVRFLSMPLAWLSIGFSLLSLFVFLYALTMADLSLAFSLDSMHHLFIALAARFVLRERVSTLRWAGTGLIVVGVVLVALSGAG